MKGIRGELLLPADVLVIPAADLSAQDRARTQMEEEDFAISRRYARSPSKVVGPSSAALLERFRQPASIVDVVRDYAEDHGLDARDVLQEVYPFVRSCVAARILVAADSPLSDRIVPIFVAGDDIDRFEVTRCVAVLDDTEVYQARDPEGQTVALKILRPDCAEWTARALEQEAGVLTALEGAGVPRLLERGQCDGRSYLALEWCPGVSPRTVAGEWRARGGAEGDRGLLDLCRSILEAYVALHEKGFLHGDVNPGNVVVDHDGRVRLLDFGFGTRAEEAARAARGGTSYYLDPEQARAKRDRVRVPPVTESAEQYSIAALLYMIMTGAHTREFSAGVDDLLRQVCEEPPLPFAARSVRPWPEVETVLARALAKEPSARFATTRAFLESWSVLEPRRSSTPHARAKQRSLTEYRRRITARIAVDGPAWRQGIEGAPRTSAAAGSTGVAYALYRMACIDDCAEQLATAEAWIARAELELQDAGAFYDGEHFTPESIGEISPYHTASGVRAVRALVSQASCDPGGAMLAARRFVADVDGRPVADDLWLGTPGVLLTCANLLPVLRAAGADAAPIVALGDRLFDELTDRIEERGPVRDCEARPNYGIAHGWAGELYAALRWSVAQGQRPPKWIRARLDELQACGEPHGRGVRWPWRDRLPDPGAASSFSAGWCNGSAGQVFLWALASRVYERPDDLDVARRAGWHAWGSKVRTPHLCCGLAGISYALLELYRATGDADWRDRAIDAAVRAVDHAGELRSGPDARFADHGLYRGELGIALLCADLERPEGAAMPLFADEGWALAIA